MMSLLLFTKWKLSEYFFDIYQNYQNWRYKVMTIREFIELLLKRVELPWIKIGIFPLIVPSEIVRKYKSLQLKLNKLSFIYSLGLNSLQSGLHKQHMKDLFVELCLTVPVRLSSLLPYLPMLMDPLVSALNGSQTLVSQVRTKLIISI